MVGRWAGPVGVVVEDDVVVVASADDGGAEDAGIECSSAEEAADDRAGDVGTEDSSAEEAADDGEDDKASEDATDDGADDGASEDGSAEDVISDEGATDDGTAEDGVSEETWDEVSVLKAWIELVGSWVVLATVVRCGRSPRVQGLRMYCIVGLPGAIDITRTAYLILSRGRARDGFRRRSTGRGYRHRPCCTDRGGLWCWTIAESCRSSTRGRTRCQSR